VAKVLQDSRNPPRLSLRVVADQYYVEGGQARRRATNR